MARKKRCVTPPSNSDLKSVSKSRRLGSKKKLKHPLNDDNGKYKLFASEDEHDSEDEWLENIKNQVHHEYALDALEFYKKGNKHADFEVTKVFYLNKSGLDHPSYDEIKYWGHLYFIAKPKKSGNKDGASTHFLAELMYGSGTWAVQGCKPFEPSDKSGKEKHDCVICGDAAKIHPLGALEFEFGHSSECKVDGWRCL